MIEKLKSSFNPEEDFFDLYKTKKLLGQGSICEGVYLCELNLTNEHFAVKILNRQTLKFFDRHRFRKEIEILKLMNHPNIAGFENYFYTPTRYFIVQEAALGLELLHLLNKKRKEWVGKEKRYLTKKQIHNIMRDILSAVAYIHN